MQKYLLICHRSFSNLSNFFQIFNVDFCFAGLLLHLGRAIIFFTFSLLLFLLCNLVVPTCSWDSWCTSGKKIVSVKTVCDISLTNFFWQINWTIWQKENLSKLDIGRGKRGKKPRWKLTCEQPSVVKQGQPVHWQNSEDLHHSTTASLCHC